MTFTVTRQHAQWVHDMARARAGLPYAYGGAFTNDPRRSTDCSGLVLQTGAWYAGRTDWVGNRYGSTESFRLDHRIVYDIGFKRLPSGGVDALPFKPVMLVGLQHGGGGVNSHTACTLMTMDIPGGPVKMSDRGVDWESRGGNPGVFLYDGARAWNDPLFHDFWYLDAVLEGGGAPDASGVDILSEAMGGAVSEDRYRQLLPAVADALIKSDCTNVNRIAMWCAQIGHESVGLKYMKEIGDAAYFSKYNNRADLGNGPTDGPRYPGRGPIQITGRFNYRKLSQWAHGKGYVPSPSFFEDHPEKLELDEYAFLGAIWYWTVARADINALSDNRDLETVTRRINGGLTGIDDRRTRYNRAQAMGNRLLALLGEGGDELADPTIIKKINEIHACLFNKVASQSLYADPGEGARWQLHELIKNQDGLGHEEFVEREALRGNPDELARVIRVAQGKGRVREDWAVARAQRVLKEIEAQNPSALEQYLSQRGQ